MNNNEPIVLGKVKKGKTGKPMVAVIIFLFIGASIFFAPTILSYFGDYNVIELIKNGQIIDFFKNHDYYMQDTHPLVPTTTAATISNEPVLLNDKAIIEYNNFTLSNFKVENDKITMTVKTSNTLNFNKSNYYFILSKSDKEISTLKLTGEISQEKEITLQYNESINDLVEIKGIVKEIKEEDYPDVTVSTDESGLGTIICTKAQNHIEYTFSNNNLVLIKDTFTYLDNNDGNYFKVFEEYSNKANELKNISADSNIIETLEGFEMITNIDLSIYQYDKNQNLNYYSLNTKAKTINFEMEAKGFDCK